MALKESQVNVTLEASGDLSAQQYRAVVVDSNGQAAVAGAAVVIDGVLQNNPAAIGRAATVAISGVVKMKCGGAVTNGGPVTTDASGDIVNAATGNPIVGIALATGSSGGIIPVLLGYKGTA